MLSSWKHFHVHNLIVCSLSSNLNYAWIESPVRVFAFACDFPGPGSQPNFPHQILFPHKHSYAHTIVSSSTEPYLLDLPDVLDFFPQVKSWPCLLLFGESHCQELWEIGQDDRGEAKQASWIWLSEPEEYRLTSFSLNFWKLQLPLNSWQRGLFFLSVCFAF